MQEQKIPSKQEVYDRLAIMNRDDFFVQIGAFGMKVHLYKTADNAREFRSAYDNILRLSDEGFKYSTDYFQGTTTIIFKN